MQTLSGLLSEYDRFAGEISDNWNNSILKALLQIGIQCLKVTFMT